MLSEQLRANFDTDIKYFRRDRILLGAGLLYMVITGLSLIPAIVFVSSTQHFDIIKSLHDSLSTAVTVVVALMGLLFMSSHFRNRSVKMVLTKPCTPETWVAALLLAAAAISLVLHLAVAAITGLLFAAWGLPFQAGLVFVTVDKFLGDLVVLAFVVFLATAMSPVLAAIVAVIANEGVFHALRTIVSAGLESSAGTALSALDKILYVAYMAVPSYSFVRHRSEVVFDTWRVQPEDWPTLLYGVAYSCAVVTLFYLLTLIVLRRKSLG
jgi:ABC-type transport system involved in multi-copper enzyme maturation permease subunit